MNKIQTTPPPWDIGAHPDEIPPGRSRLRPLPDPDPRCLVPDCENAPAVCVECANDAHRLFEAATAPQQPEATPLDALETSGFHSEALAETFRHSGWARLRRRVHDAMDATGQSIARRDAFRTCGANCYVLQAKNDPTNLKLAASCCHDRFCLPCANSRSRTIAANVAPYLKGAPIRFITLTLRHNDSPLSVEIERLYRCFKELRKHPLWKNTQRGGAAFLEIKRSRDRKSWHPHFHVVSQGKFIDLARLQLLWKSITKDSWIVDVRLVRNAENVTQYVTKYASKPFDGTLFESPDTLAEAMIALQGRRMIVTFGNWKGLQMTEKPNNDAWDFLDTLEGLLHRAAAGDVAAEKIVNAVCGEKAKALIEKAGRHTPARMNVGRPPTPDPELYLIDVAGGGRCGF